MGKLKIVSDGTASGTKVTDDKGNEITHITSITWYVDANEVSQAIIKLSCVEVELTGELKE